MAAYNESLVEQFDRTIRPVLFNTESDGSGTWLFPVVNAGGVPVAGAIKTVSVAKVCEAEGAYSAADVISESDTASAGTAWTFLAVARVNGASGYITGARIISETTALTPRLVLYLFTATPTCELDDNAPNTANVWADRANVVGQIDFPAMNDNGTGASASQVSPSTVGGLPVPFTCASGADDLIGVLVTLDAFDQVDDKSIRIDLTVEQY